MRSLRGRIEKLEHRAGDDEQMGLIVRVFSVDTVGLPIDRCSEILRECGFLRRDTGLIDFTKIPKGLNTAQLERYLRKHGDAICPRPRRAGAQPYVEPAGFQ